MYIYLYIYICIYIYIVLNSKSTSGFGWKIMIPIASVETHGALRAKDLGLGGSNGLGGAQEENHGKIHGKITGKSMGKIRELNDFLASHVTDGWRLKSCAKYQDMS